MPQIYNPKIEKRYKTAVLPHHSDSCLKRLGKESDVPLLSVSDPPFEVISGILTAERLVTSSLHGLIIAEAYGLPVGLLRHRDQIWEKHFKYEDYYLSTGREDCTLWDLSIEDAVKKIPDIPKPEPIDTDLLISSFPKAFLK